MSFSVVRSRGSFAEGRAGGTSGNFGTKQADGSCVACGETAGAML